MKQGSLTRIAPTPSGFLHIGNALSFAVTSALAEKTGAAVLLRIDDLDQARARPEYLQDIFDTLHFLDIPWQQGPVSVADFKEKYTQEKRMPLYNQALQRLRDADRLFACDCSRTLLVQQPCCCAQRSLSLDTPGTSWRIRTDSSPVSFYTAAGERIEKKMPESMQHCIVRKKDGYPSYQLASVCDDIYWNVDLIVRGQDLFDSTIAQLFLARYLDASSFTQAVFCHHPLIEQHGVKLSKSAGATAIRYLRQRQKNSAAVYQLMAEAIGLTTKISDRHSLTAHLPFALC
ncbi:glutamate--tRNA ligase family protein [Sediminibacterium soli]|uniref:glutamate--tRNA ligase family protein n=1 Tax=Sediminibacterium soli TaxID=2698829 RepID=UPI00137A4C7A|nr:glutamate--tRNA ligase family protein [Sediminibacterium soli]NCI45655.1 tRNA glutamyl-Q synthetase [Sediminibacterium soli]